MARKQKKSKPKKVPGVHLSEDVIKGCILEVKEKVEEALSLYVFYRYIESVRGSNRRIWITDKQVRQVMGWSQVKISRARKELESIGFIKHGLARGIKGYYKRSYIDILR